MTASQQQRDVPTIGAGDTQCLCAEHFRDAFAGAVYG